MPNDFWGRQTCASCSCVGAADDARHFAEDAALQHYPDVADEVRALERRRIGEHDDP
ncbi:hypothetical protein GCM10010532_113670 [Dactylosporangium siamense]|uniref:Uncharacterized protein n=1 Tax=Dactylosporangium siamense TaxID=685454 RepID=A0A919PZE5_9ACTN|nr:hypothetical protein Dsi01nite_112200 [Dactylosporangium siamense]